jgi:hypothetical protein
MDFCTHRVVQIIISVERLPGVFPRQLGARLSSLIADYANCSIALQAYYKNGASQLIPSADVFRLYFFQQYMLRKELVELCDRFDQWTDLREPFDLFPQASAEDTLSLLELIEFRGVYDIVLTGE